MRLERSIHLAIGEVPYTLERTNRRTLAITVQPDGSVLISAPTQVELGAIEAKLRKRAAWILKARRHFERLGPRTPARRYFPGETHRFLGRQYRLQIDPVEQGVRLSHDRLIVGALQSEESAVVKTRLDLWYAGEAKRVFTLRLDLIAAALRLPTRPRLIVRPLQKRWGSLGGTGRSLTLNRRLIEANVEAIDFVIMHELCHIAHHNHGDEFYLLLSARMPDWVQRKARLEQWML